MSDVSEYDGPAFNKRQHRSDKNRRFNRLTDRDGSKRIFDNTRNQTADKHDEPLYYELPKKVRSIDQREDLAPPVDRQQLNARIENAQLHQSVNGKERYSVPFLKQQHSDSSDKVFLNQQVADSEPEAAAEETTYQPSERFKSKRYQPALTEQPIALSKSRADVTMPIETAAQSEAKSIEASKIREVAVRLTKEKSSYLLFEYSKEN